MKKYLFYLGFAGTGLMFGCHSYNEGIVGKYQSKKRSLVSKTYLSVIKNTTFVIGSSLEIKSDSTFYLDNCGNIEDGKWQIHGDSLLLFCEHNRWRIDSLNKTGFNSQLLDCGDGTPIVFIIDKNVLKQQWKSNGRLILNYFKKVE